MTRKKSKHRRAVAGLNPVAKAVSGAQPLTAQGAEYTRMAQINARSAAAALRHGKATRQDAGLLAAAFNVTALLVGDLADGNAADVLHPWRDAVLNVHARGDGAARPEELDAIADGLDLHDALLAKVTLAEMAAVLERLKAHALAGLLMEVPGA